ncbi:MAG TPA: serine/threonine-protein kinase [Myxococcales bacterium]|nr:serine/threonine-protein kinase [Myxococcales bacterium]
MELGRYRLDEQVGQGGMAVVWRGWDTQLRRTVAVKVLHAHLNAREEIRRRFDREAHAVARLHHPHILDVYDFSGPQAEPSYLVTEFIRGETLRTFAERHPFDPPELAAACLLPIAEALHHAHAAGVVHRDLKPENVMVRDDGVVKLTDFGIAALLDPDEKFTATGSILGSPAHLAPETIEGKPADPRSDLFSFGTILYWLSCGELPYQASTPAALLRSILEGKRQDPRQIRPSVSDAQAKVIARCLQNDPAKRYQSALELKEDLLQLLNEAGFDEPEGELKRFVLDPEAQAATVRARLVSRSLEAGEAQLREGKTSGALAAFGRALALDPQDVQARGRVERIRRRERLTKFARRSLIGLAALLALLFAGWNVRAAVMQARAQAAARRAAEDASARRAIEDAAAAAASEQPPPPPAPREGAAAAERAGAPRTGPATPAGERQVPPARAAKELAERNGRTKVASLEPLQVKLHARFGAQVSVDGVDAGNTNMFSLRLAPGAHRVLVRHPCCADATQDVLVTKNRPDQLYQLRYGPPLPAKFRVLNAPDDARVLVEGVLVGTASDPRPYAMTRPDQRAIVTIGDRTLVTTLKAGMLNVLDYAQASP